jgi:hypothetical protein
MSGICSHEQLEILHKDQNMPKPQTNKQATANLNEIQAQAPDDDVQNTKLFFSIF